MASQISGKALRTNAYGVRVERTAATVPATGNQTIFTVSGGRVMVTGILGEVTTVMSATATNLKVTAVGTASAVATDICSNVAITSATVGTLFSPTTIGAAGQTGSAVSFQNETIMHVGIIRITTDATNTGAMKWLISYMPLDDGATIAAA